MSLRAGTRDIKEEAALISRLSVAPMVER